MEANVFQLHVVGLQQKTHTITITSPNPEKITVAELKKMIEEKTGLEAEYQQLHYLCKVLTDRHTLGDYNMRNGANITMVMRLTGGSEREHGMEASLSREIDASLPRSSENCMITMENTKESGIVVLKMPCDHSISPDGLMDYSWAEVSNNKKSEIKCPLCSTEWEFDIIRKYGGATDTELSLLELGISKNFCTQRSDINQCPKCQSYCTRQNVDVSSVRCVICTRNSGSSWNFCWFCLREWKNSLSASYCGNANCNDTEKLAQLRECGKVRVSGINSKVFKIRACPNCGTLVELTGGCKHMTCKACGDDFCFVCLRRKSQGSWSCGSYSTKCDEAPRQTVIPGR